MGFKATGTTAPELREQLSGLDNADTTMKDAVKECEASTFDPTGYKAKEKIKELRIMVENAVGCAFEENLFNANGSKNGKNPKVDQVRVRIVDEVGKVEEEVGKEEVEEGEVGNEDEQKVYFVLVLP